MKIAAIFHQLTIDRVVVVCSLPFFLPSVSSVSLPYRSELWDFLLLGVLFHDWTHLLVRKFRLSSHVQTLNQLGSIRRGAPQNNMQAWNNSLKLLLLLLESLMLREERFLPRHLHKYYFIQLLQTLLKERLQRQSSVLQSLFFFNFGCCYFAASFRLFPFPRAGKWMEAWLNYFAYTLAAWLVAEDFNCTSQFAAFVAIMRNYPRALVTIWLRIRKL